MLDEPAQPLPKPQEIETTIAHGDNDPGSQPLTNMRHERFAQEVARGASQAEAYRLAGYNLSDANRDSNAARLSGDERVKARTSYLMQRAAQKLAKHHDITSDRILAELALIGFARMTDYAGLLETGNLDHVTSEQSAAITELSVHTDKHGNKRARIKLGSKREALVDLGKATGLFDDRPDITVPVTFVVQRTKRSDVTIDHEDDSQ